MKWRGIEESNPAQHALSLRQELEQRKALAEQYVPAATRAIHQHAIDELQASGILDRILPQGGQAPAFELPDQDGNAVSSLQILNRGRLLICFFRGRWCPFCVAQLEAMNAILPQIRQAGASLVGISPQTVKQSYFMHDQHKLGFPLLSDAGNAVARQFGLVYSVGQEQRAVYARSFTNLPFINGDASWELPIPATYILRRDARVAFGSADADYRVRPEPSDLLLALSAV
jgi:peroxiredoxin